MILLNLTEMSCTLIGPVDLERSLFDAFCIALLYTLESFKLFLCCISVSRGLQHGHLLFNYGKHCWAQLHFIDAGEANLFAKLLLCLGGLTVLSFLLCLHFRFHIFLELVPALITRELLSLRLFLLVL